jgi:hypothetical protein
MQTVHGRDGKTRQKVSGKNKPELGVCAMGLLYEEESYRVLGACFEVYKEVSARPNQPCRAW